MASLYFRYTACAALFLFLCWHKWTHVQQKVDIVQSPFPNEVLPCPNLNNSALIESNGVPNSRVAILMAITDKQFAFHSAPAINTTLCYALHFGYPVVVLDLVNATLAAECPHGDVFFRRHCAVYKWMERNKADIDYVLYIDADMGVINPCHTIQEYFDDPAEMIFYDRFYDFEIAAGSYLAKNTEFSRSFIKYWADYFYKLPKSFHGTDNGAIHQVFMEHIFKTPEEKMACYYFWNISKSYEDLFKFQACTQAKYGLHNSKFCDGKLKVIRKDSIGWVRDVWLTYSKWSPRDFMLHGLKIEKMNKPSPIGGEWEWQFYRKTLDLDICRRVSLSFMYKYNASYITTDTEILGLLKFWKNRAINLMNTDLKAIGMAPVE